MMYNRERHGAALLANGQVLVAGGNSFPVYPGSLTSELYNPATGKWTVTGSLKVSHIDAEAALLQDGRVLMAGCLDPPTRQEVSTKEARVRTIRAKFQGRHVHVEVLRYCRVERMQDNYFHAVFKAAKGYRKATPGRTEAVTNLAYDVGTTAPPMIPVLKIPAKDPWCSETEFKASETCGDGS